MSLHESVIFSLVFIIMMSIIWKWTKALLAIINLEMATALIISCLYLSGSMLSSMLLFTLVFFVSEALIILSSLYSSMSFMGVAYGGLLFW